MEPAVRNNAEQSRYEIVVDGAVAGFAQYDDQGAQVALTHTEVDSSYEGQGVGSRLARGVLDDVREQGRAVLPHCPFLRDYIQRHPEYADLVPGDRRAEFDL